MKYSPSHGFSSPRTFLSGCCETKVQLRLFSVCFVCVRFLCCVCCVCFVCAFFVFCVDVFLCSFCGCFARVCGWLCFGRALYVICVCCVCVLCVFSKYLCAHLFKNSNFGLKTGSDPDPVDRTRIRPTWSGSGQLDPTNRIRIHNTVFRNAVERQTLAQYICRLFNAWHNFCLVNKLL